MKLRIRLSQNYPTNTPAIVGGILYCRNLYVVECLAKARCIKISEEGILETFPFIPRDYAFDYERDQFRMHEGYFYLDDEK